MWAAVTDFDGKYFMGKLANDPEIIQHLKYGDEVVILITDVEDWILNDYLTHTKVGGFSQEYLRDKE